MEDRELNDSFDDDPLINSAFLTMFRNALVSFAAIPVFRCLYSWKLCYHDSLNGITLQYFMIVFNSCQ